MIKKFMNSSLRLRREEHTDRIGGRKAFSVEICTGFLNPSMITVKFSFHHWKKKKR